MEKPAKVAAIGFLPKWKKTKETFFKATGVKKPRSKAFYGLVSKPTEGLDKALTKVDKALLDYDVALHKEQDANKKGTLKGYKESPIRLNGLRLTVLDFQKSRASYVKVLAAAGTKSPPQDATNPAVYKNALAMLDKQLKYLDSVLKLEYNSRATIFKQIKAGSERIDALQQQSDTIVGRIRATVDKAQAFIATQRVKPKFDRNKFVPALMGAARDISVNLNSLELVANKNPNFRLPNGPPPAMERQALNVWHTGDGLRALPENASRDDMLRELFQFEKLVAAIDQWAG